MKFKVGDSVVWCGAKGRVVKIWKFKSEFAASIQVEFAERAKSNSYTVPMSATFLPDGRMHYWHTEPSLILDAES